MKVDLCIFAKYLVTSAQFKHKISNIEVILSIVMKFRTRSSTTPSWSSSEMLVHCIFCAILSSITVIYSNALL